MTRFQAWIAHIRHNWNNGYYTPFGNNKLTCKRYMRNLYEICRETLPVKQNDEPFSLQSSKNALDLKIIRRGPSLWAQHSRFMLGFYHFIQHWLLLFLIFGTMSCPTHVQSMAREGMKQGAICLSYVGVTHAGANRILQRQTKTGCCAPDKSTGKIISR